MSPILLNRLPILFCLLILFTINVYAQSEYLYLNRNSSDANTISALSIASDGSLTELPTSPFLTGGSATRGGNGRRDVIVFGSFLFAANDCSSDVSAFTINPLTGSLSLIPGTPISTRGTFNCVSDGISLAITPNGKFLMAGNTGDGTLAVFSVAPNGALAHVQGSPFQTVGEPLDMKVTPDNKFLVIASGIFGGVEVYSISSSGIVTAVQGSPFLRDGQRAPGTLDIRCDGKIFVEGGFGIDVLNISDTGQLSPISGSPFMPLLNTFTNLGRLSSDEKFLFASQPGFTPVIVFSVAPDGTPTLVPGAGASLVTDSSLSVITNRSGNRAFFGTFGGEILISTPINPNGTLGTSISFFPITTNAGGVPGLAIFPAKVCGPQFDICIQDESNGSLLQINTTTGEYQFNNCSGFTISGVGLLTKRGSSITLQHNTVDRRVLAKIDDATKTAIASIQIFSQGRTFTISDRNTSNNTCTCQ